MTPAAGDFLLAMEHYLGTHEDPIGANPSKNNSPVNVEWGASGPDWPWCAMTVWLALQHSGFTEVPKTASCKDLRTWAQAGKFHLSWHSVDEARPGDIFIFHNDAHTGAVEYLQGGGFVSCEGNWGDKCQRVVRTDWSAIAGLVRPAYALTLAQDTPPKTNVPPTHVQVPGTLRRGDTGLEVWLVQLRLNTLRGVLIHAGQQAWGPDGPDGEFGPIMELNVAAFQAKFQVDSETGVYGPITQGKLSSVEAFCGIHY